MKLSSRHLIQEAWEFTQDNKKLIILYALVPALITTLIGIVYLGYQYYSFLGSPLFEDWEQSFFEVLLHEVVALVTQNFSETLPFITVAAVIGLLYILVPPICEGAIIQLVARKRNKQPVRTRDGLRYGLLNFLPLFEYSWFTRTFGWISTITWGAFLYKNLGPEALNVLFPIIIIFFIAGMILTLLFTYTEFFIVIDGRRVIESISKSTELVVTHLEQTILLSILMIIIGIRILVQVLFILLIPAVMVAIVYFIAAGTFQWIALTIATVVGLILLYLASYLSATLHVFATSLWTFTFLELTQEEEISAREKMDQ